MTNEAKCASSSTCGKSSCEGCPSAQHGPVDFSVPLNANAKVKHVIGIVSGKGGVGKSLVTGLLASAMQAAGQRAAVLDADITGPSMGKAFGINGHATGSEAGIDPKLSTTGVQLITANMFLKNDTEPVIWRGPVIAGMVKQFWGEVCWKNVDYMFVDMPPGTGDVPLTVFQSLPVDGIIIVTSPQELVSMIVNKAVKMAKMMNIPILGMIENFSYFHCPDNGKDYEIFGTSHLADTAMAYGLPVLARLPIDPTIAAKVDKGEIEQIKLDAIEKCAELIRTKLP